MSSAEPAPPEVDPYRLSPQGIVEPPSTLLETLRRTGPGMILAASIVGSGELIATTTLGAQEGFGLLWLILLSCLVKPVIQAELGRYAIATGEPSLPSFDRVPGPRLGAGWVVWGWAVMVMMTQLQVGAMYGGLAQVMGLLFPAVPLRAWVGLFYALTLLLLLGGGYRRIERLAVIKVALFTLLTVLAAVLLLGDHRYVSWRALAEGFRLQMPSAGLATAIAVFGATGVGTSELAMYPYWCVEKGYARFTGPRDGSGAWARRARGWIRVMHTDIVVSLVVYSVATVAFFLLGAGVLHGTGTVPKGNDMIAVLSRIYTETLGPWALPVFYVGAIATLYGTIFAATAAHARIYADLACLLGAYQRDDYPARRRWQGRFVWVLTSVPVALYLLIESPVKMVIAGAMAQSVMLPVVAFGTVYLRHRHLPPEVAPSRRTTAALWIGSLTVLVVMVASVVLTIRT
jgi:Mn2+/Fe2+ NRAMP family transporter